MTRRLLPLALLIAACASGVDTRSAKPERTEQDEAKYAEAVSKGIVKIGMVKSEVQKAWGKPLRADRTKYRKRDVTRWSYMTREVYFDKDGFVLGYRGY